jgi:hypothetical protein
MKKEIKKFYQKLVKLVKNIKDQKHADSVALTEELSANTILGFVEDALITLL